MKSNNNQKFIPVAEPAFVGNEMKYVQDCIRSGWISSIGEYIKRFEESFAEYCGVRHAIACCNGTAALHLSMLALGIDSEDEVILPTLTYIATANAVTYCGGRPVLIDSEPATWTMDCSLIERKISKRTKAIIAVHLFGHPADMGALRKLADKYGLYLVEDAAEAHGAKYKDRLVGSLSDVAIYSFYGNKILTTGEGGMVVTDNGEIAESIRQLRGQGVDTQRRYWHPIIGYNYRMTNIAAAIGLAQLEKCQWHISRRREIHKQYEDYLAHVPGIEFQKEQKWAENVYWMNALTIDDTAKNAYPARRDLCIQRLCEAGVESRPFFYPMHQLPMYRSAAENQRFPVAEDVANRGICLPSSALLKESDVRYVSTQLKSAIEECRSE